ncbi:MAG: dipeptide epimerase [Pirellulales bacterium]
MQLNTFTLKLPLAHPFTISRGTMTEQSSLIVQLHSDGISGWGEVTQNRYYNRTVQSLAQSVEKAKSILPLILGQSPETTWPMLMELLDGDTFAVSAIDNAAHDWHARKNGVPTWKYWGLNWNPAVKSSYTIAIDSIEKMLAKLNERPNWPIYKIKLGTKDDLSIVRSLRQATQATFRVDANCGWSAQQTIDLSHELKELNVEFIEQPLPREANDSDQERVFAQSALPIIADESCQTEGDVTTCLGRFHGINVKICKCGGLTPALRMLIQAKSKGIKTMVGCMVESSIGISAAAQLLPLLDFADLDGSALLASDPTEGVSVTDGLISLRNENGHGCRLPDGHA